MEKGGAFQTFMQTISAALGAAADVANKTIEEAYNKGFQDGAHAMRDSIMKAATAPLDVPSSPSTMDMLQRAVEAKQAEARAPRGAVRKFIRETLAVHGPLTQQDIRELAGVIEGLAASSVGNELRRQEGTLYRRDEADRWHLIEKESVTDKAEPVSATQEAYLLPA